MTASSGCLGSDITVRKANVPMGCYNVCIYSKDGDNITVFSFIFLTIFPHLVCSPMESEKNEPARGECPE